MNDPALRRGIWKRETLSEDGIVTLLEICAGREGDDDYIRLEAGENLSSRKLSDIAGALQVGAWMVSNSALDEVVAIPSVFSELMGEVSILASEALPKEPHLSGLRAAWSRLQEVYKLWNDGKSMQEALKALEKARASKAAP